MNSFFLTIKGGWVHFPVGLVNVGMLVIDPALGIVFGVGFLGYEAVQEYCQMGVKGKSHRYIQGWLWGLVCGGIVWTIIEAVI